METNRLSGFSKKEIFHYILKPEKLRFTSKHFTDREEILEAAARGVLCKEVFLEIS